MKKIFRCLSIALSIITTNASFSQSVPTPYEVSTWSGFRATAINYTFDDGCSNQFNIAIPLFDEFEFKLTLFTVTNWISNWSALQSAAANGHEVAGHSASHANFGSITLEQLELELKNPRDLIESNIPDKKCITMAYPYCVLGNDSVCGIYYISARGCQGYIEPKTPKSYFNVSSLVVGDQSSINELTDFKVKFESAANSNGWCVFLLHGIDNDGGYSPITSTELRKSVEYLAARKSKFWVTTFANATLYSKERDVVKVEETSATDTSFTLNVTDTLPDSLYIFPLTLRRPLPENWPSANVTQDSVAVPARIVLVDSVVYLTFDVVPDAGEVKITRNLTPVTPEVDTIPADEEEEEVSRVQTNDINDNFNATISKGFLTISFSGYNGLNLIVRLFDIRGIELLSKKVNYSGENEITVDLTEKNLTTGVYLVYLSDGKDTWNSKIILS
jgi:oligosaccharide reducing-end xylanase